MQGLGGTMDTPRTLLSAKLAGHTLRDSPNPASYVVPWLDRDSSTNFTFSGDMAPSCVFRAVDNESDRVRSEEEPKTSSNTDSRWCSESTSNELEQVSGRMRGGGRCRTLSSIELTSSHVNSGSPAAQRKAEVEQQSRRASCPVIDSWSSSSRLRSRSMSASSDDLRDASRTDNTRALHSRLPRHTASLASLLETARPQSAGGHLKNMDVTVGHLPLTSGLLTDSLDTAEDEADAKEFAPIDGSDTKCVDEVPMSVETVNKISAGALLISPVIRPPRVSELLPATMPPDAESRELLEVGPDIRGDRFARCILPTTGQYHQFNDTIRQASPATIHKLIHGGFADRVDQHLVMDCRFPFEYDGGHIAGAINFWSAEKAIHKLFIEPELRLGNDGRTVIILYCEFSSHRAPTMFQSIRLIDEAITASTGGLLLPELYILEGGYSTYFDAYLTDCTPRSYRKMKNKAYIDQNSRYETMMRRSWEVVSDFANFADRPEIAKLMNTVNENGVCGVELDEWLSGGSQSPLPATRQRSRSPCTPPCQVLSNPT